MLVAQVVEILAAPVEPTAHLLLERIDFDIENAGGPSPLGKMTESKPRQESMSRTDAFAEAGAVIVLVGDQLLVAYLGLSRAVL